jgi:hypothetical protein
MSVSKLHELLENITTSEQLATFIDELRQDFTRHPDHWQNIDLDQCLDAMAAWVRDMERAKAHRDDLPLASYNAFRLCGELLYAAKNYE